MTGSRSRPTRASSTLNPLPLDLAGALRRSSPTTSAPSRHLIVDTSKLSGALAERAPDISALVGNLNTMMGAIGNQKLALADGDREVPRLHAQRRTPPSSTCAPRSMTSTPWSRPPTRGRRARALLRRVPRRRRRRGAHDPRPRRDRPAPRARQRPRRAHPRPGLRSPSARSAPARPTAAAPRSLRPRERRRRRRLPQGAFGESVCALTNGNGTLAIFRAYTPELVGWFDDFSHPGTIDALGGVGRIGTTFNTFTRVRQRLPRPRVARRSRHRSTAPAGPSKTTSTSSAPAPRSARCPRRSARAGTPSPTRAASTAIPTDVPTGAMRRLGFILSVVAATAATFAVSAPADDEHTYMIEMYNAFGVVKGSDVRVAGVNAGTVTDLDVNSAKRAVVTVSTEWPARRPGRGHHLRDPAAVADRRVLHRLPTRRARDRAERRRRGPGHPRRGGLPDRPDRPRPQHAARALQAPAAAADQRVRHRARRQPGEPERGDPPRRPGAHLDSSRCWTSSATRTRIIRDLNVRLRSDHHPPRRRAARTSCSVHRGGARHRRRLAPSAATTSRPTSTLLDDFLAELKPTLVELETRRARVDPAAHRPSRLGAGPERADHEPAGVQRRHRRLARLRSARPRWSASRRCATARRRSRRSPSPGPRRPSVGEMLADLFARPRRPEPRRRRSTRAPPNATRAALAGASPTGYTGLEGLLNYAYYQAGSLNQYDQVGHLLHFASTTSSSGPCGAFTTGRDPETGATELPNTAGGTTRRRRSPASTPTSVRRLARRHPAGHHRPEGEVRRCRPTTPRSARGHRAAAARRPTLCPGTPEAGQLRRRGGAKRRERPGPARRRREPRRRSRPRRPAARPGRRRPTRRPQDLPTCPRACSTTSPTASRTAWTSCATSAAAAAKRRRRRRRRWRRHGGGGGGNAVDDAPRLPASGP